MAIFAAGCGINPAACKKEPQVVSQSQVHIKAMAQLNKDMPAYNHLIKGYEELAEGNAQKVLALVQEGLTIEPDNPLLYNLKGKAESSLDQDGEALASFNKAIQLNARCFDIYFQRGLLEYKLGNYASAKSDLEISVELLPLAEAYYTLGQIDLKHGRRADALANFKIAAKADAEISRLAGKEAARIELVRNPREYLIVQIEGHLHGYLKLSILNKSAFPIKNAIVQLTFYNSERMPYYRRTVTIVETIQSNQKILKTTSIAPPKSKSIQTQILRVEIAD
jgi:beta-barrel assembly-enhancing protease